MRGLAASWERFWFHKEIETSRLVALRVVFFGVLGLDQLYLMVEKGYRYGTGDFNVAHRDIDSVSIRATAATALRALDLDPSALGRPRTVVAEEELAAPEEVVATEEIAP